MPCQVIADIIQLPVCNPSHTSRPCPNTRANSPPLTLPLSLALFLLQRKLCPHPCSPFLWPCPCTSLPSSEHGVQVCGAAELSLPGLKGGRGAAAGAWDQHQWYALNASPQNINHYSSADNQYFLAHGHQSSTHEHHPSAHDHSADAAVTVAWPQREVAYMSPQLSRA